MRKDDKKERKSDFYLGNSQLKKKNVVTSYTEKQISEYTKCYQDVLYFVKNYVYIISLDKGRVLFDLYDFQLDMIDKFQKNRYVISCLARQLGKTTVVAAFLFHQLIFNKDFTIAILANKGSKAREILSRIKLMYEMLPWWIKPGVVEWNKGSIQFDNRSKCFAAATSNSSIRGESVNIVYLDEAAFIDNMEEFYTSTYPVISSGKNTKVLITSTPNGMNLFYKLFTDAQKKRNFFVPVLYTWKAHPDRDEKWKEETLSNTSKKQFSQEFDCKFLGSAGTLVSGECLETLVHESPKIEDEHSKLYAKPKKDHNYILLVDVCEGVGKDFSTIQIIDVTTKPYQQVFVYKNNEISPWDFPAVIAEIAKNYNNAFVVVENNDEGKIVADTLFYEIEYDNMLCGEIDQRKDNFTGWSSKTIGLKITKTTKKIGCSSLKKLVEDRFIDLVDFDTISELTTYVKVKNSYGAEKGKHDDLVSPLVIFGWLTTQVFFEDLTSKNMRSLVREKREEEDEKEHSAFGFFDDGIDEDVNLF